MKVLILAAGYGTRLYPLVTNTPKPLLPVANKPLIDHIVDKLGCLSGLDELFVVTNEKFHEDFEKWACKIRAVFPAPVRIVNDGTTAPENRLGSVGDIDFVAKNYSLEDDDLLVLGGDNLFDYQLDEYVSLARTKHTAVTVGLYDICHLADAAMYGVVEMAPDGRLLSFEEKPSNPRSTLISMCCYYFPKATLAYLEQYKNAVGKMDKAGEYIRWLCEEKEVCGFKFSGKWYDIGSIESYQEAQAKFK